MYMGAVAVAAGTAVVAVIAAVLLTEGREEDGSSWIGKPVWIFL